MLYSHQKIMYLLQKPVPCCNQIVNDYKKYTSCWSKKRLKTFLTTRMLSWSNKFIWCLESLIEKSHLALNFLNLWILVLFEYWFNLFDSFNYSKIGFLWNIKSTIVERFFILKFNNRYTHLAFIQDLRVLALTNSVSKTSKFTNLFILTYSNGIFAQSDLKTPWFKDSWMQTEPQ